MVLFFLKENWIHFLLLQFEQYNIFILDMLCNVAHRIAFLNRESIVRPSPADPLQGCFQALLPLGRCQTWTLINTRGVWPNILLDIRQAGRLGFHFSPHVHVCVCWEKVRSLQKPEQSLAVRFAFVGSFTFCILIDAVHALCAAAPTVDGGGSSALCRKLPALLLSHPAAAP